MPISSRIWVSQRIPISLAPTTTSSRSPHFEGLADLSNRRSRIDPIITIYTTGCGGQTHNIYNWCITLSLELTERYPRLPLNAGYSMVLSQVIHSVRDSPTDRRNPPHQPRPDRPNHRCASPPTQHNPASNKPEAVSNGSHADVVDEAAIQREVAHAPWPFRHLFGHWPRPPFAGARYQMSPDLPLTCGAVVVILTLPSTTCTAAYVAGWVHDRTTRAPKGLVKVGGVHVIFP